MEIKIGKKTITSKSICKLMFIMVLFATITQMIINLLSDRSIFAGMVVFSACVTVVCYYFSKERV